MQSNEAFTARRRFLIEGHVQGVGFRESTRHFALTLGDLRGIVRNLPDGRVEVVALGGADSLSRLATWLSHGPPSARVDRVLEAAAPEGGDFTGFRVERILPGS